MVTVRILLAIGLAAPFAQNAAWAQSLDVWRWQPLASDPLVKRGKLALDNGDTLDVQVICGKKARMPLWVQCNDSSNRPKRHILEDGAIIDGSFSQSKHVSVKELSFADTWQFSPLPDAVSCVAISDATSCDLVVLQRQLPSDAFFRLQWRSQTLAQLKQHVRKSSPFEAEEQQWLEASAQGRWVDRYRVLRPMPAKAAAIDYLRPVTGNVILPEALRWMPEQQRIHWWRSKNATWHVKGPAILRVKARTLSDSDASELCLTARSHVSVVSTSNENQQQFCQRTTEASYWDAEGGRVTRRAVVVEGVAAGSLLSWRIAVPPGDHMVVVRGAEVMAQAVRYALYEDWENRAGFPTSPVVFPPDWRITPEAVPIESADPTNVSALAEPIRMMKPTKAPAPDDGHSWIALDTLNKVPTLHWLDEAQTAWLWFKPDDSVCAVDFGKDRFWALPHTALNRFIRSVASSDNTRAIPRSPLCPALIRVSGSLPRGVKTHSLLRLQRVRPQHPLSFELGGLSVAGVQVSWPADGTVTRSVVLRLAAGDRLTIRPLKRRDDHDPLHADDGSLWRHPVSVVWPDIQGAVAVTTEGVAGVRMRVRARPEGAPLIRLPQVVVAQPDAASRQNIDNTAATALARVRSLTKQLNRAVSDGARATLHLRRAEQLFRLGVIDLAYHDCRWVLQLTKDVSTAQYARMLIRRAAAQRERAEIGYDGSVKQGRKWHALDPGWIELIHARPSRELLQKAANEDYLALALTPQSIDPRDRLTAWRDAILSGQPLRPGERLRAFRDLLRFVGDTRYKQTAYWPLRGMSQWDAVEQVEGAETTARVLDWSDDDDDPQLELRASALDALFDEHWPTDRDGEVLRLSSSLELRFSVTQPLELKGRCLAVTPDAAHATSRFEVVRADGVRLADKQCDNAGTPVVLQIQPQMQPVYVRGNAAAGQLQQLRIPPVLAHALSKERRRLAWKLVANKPVRLQVLGPTVVRFDVQSMRKTGSNSSAFDVVTWLVQPHDTKGETLHGVSTFNATTTALIPVEHKGPVTITVTPKQPALLAAAIRVPKQRAFEPYTDRALLYAAALPSDASAYPQESKISNVQQKRPAYAITHARPLRYPPTTAYAGFFAGSEPVLDDPNQDPHVRALVVTGLASRPMDLPLWFDLDLKTVISSEPAVFVGRLGGEWWPIRDRWYCGLSSDFSVAHGSPGEKTLTSGSWDGAAFGGYWFNPRLSFHSELSYVERVIISGADRGDAGYGDQPVLWSTYRKHHPRAFRLIARLRWYFRDWLALTGQTNLGSNAYIDQVPLERAYFDAYADLMLPGMWFRVGSGIDTRIADVNRDDHYVNGVFYGRGWYTWWFTGNIAAQVGLSLRYQTHGSEFSVLLGPRFLFSRDRALTDLRPSANPHKSFSAWHQDDAAMRSYTYDSPKNTEAK